MIFENVQVDIEQLPTVEAVNYQKLAPAYLKVSFISSLIFYALLLIGMLLFFKFSKLAKYEMLVYILPALWLLLTGSGLCLVVLAYRIKAYALREKDIIYRKGVIIRSVTTIPFNRVQHCEIKQGPIERYFGLKTLALFTAGGQASDLKIPGLMPSDAERLKAYIIKTTAEDEEE